MVDRDYILVDPDLDEMTGKYEEGCKYFYLVDEQLWYFSSLQEFENGHQALQSGFGNTLNKEDLLFVENRDQFVALCARLFMDPAMEFSDAIEPFRASRKSLRKK